jgi:hypothetical protein
MQKLGGRGWGILAGAISGASKGYDEYAEKEIKKQRAEALKEALGGMGYDKYSQFVDPTTGELNELGGTFLKSDLDQQEMLAKYAALGDLEAMKRAGRLAADKELADYKHGLDYGSDMNLQNLKFEQQKELRRLFPSTGRSGGRGGKPEMPLSVKLNQKMAEGLLTKEKAWEAYVLDKGIDSDLPREDIAALVGYGVPIPKQTVTTYKKGDTGFLGTGLFRTPVKALTPEALAFRQTYGFPLGGMGVARPKEEIKKNQQSAAPVNTTQASRRSSLKPVTNLDRLLPQ